MNLETPTNTAPVTALAFVGHRPLLSEFDTPEAVEYVSKLFQPGDRIAIMLLKEGLKPVHKFLAARELSGIFEKLQKADDGNWNIYLCMNPLKEDRRVKENIAAVRTLYLDVDADLKGTMDKVFQSPLVPPPNFILHSSPDKGYIVWLLESGLTNAEQESLLKALIQEFGTDPAASDVTRVLRLPGFRNHKYPAKPLVEIIHHGSEVRYRHDQFKVILKSEKKVQPPNEKDPRFKALCAEVGFKPLVRRMNSLPDNRSHVDALDLNPGELHSCPFHIHTDYSGNFGVIRENPILVHCLGRCAGKIDTWDVVAAVAQFDRLKNPFEAAKVICKEEGLDYEKFFPNERTSADTDTLESEIVEEPLPEFPVIPGTIGELAEVLAPDVPREFKIMAATTRIGLMLTGRVCLGSEPFLQPRFYTCLVAPPGRGKGAATNETRCLDGVCDYLWVPSVDSGPALVDAFVEQAERFENPTGLSKVLLIPDEMTYLFEKSKSGRDSRNSLFGELLTLYEYNSTGNRARRNEGDNPELQNAALAMLGGATEQGFDEMWTASRGASGGLQSRFCVIVTTAPPIPGVQRLTDAIKLAPLLSRIKTQINQTGIKLGMTEDAQKMLQEWAASHQGTNAETRSADMVKRFLMVLAVTNDTNTIDSPLMKVGIEFGDYLIKVRERWMPVDASSVVQKFEHVILDMFKRHGQLTERDLVRLVHPDRRPGGFQSYNMAVAALQRSGRIIRAGTKNNSTRTPIWKDGLQ
jgi:RepB DNA-primase from phage plasmid